MLARVYVWSRIQCGWEPRAERRYANDTIPARLVPWLFKPPEEIILYNTDCSIQDRHVGFVDKTGRYVIAPRSARMSDFSEGLACVCEGSGLDWKCGFIDHGGRTVIPMRFSGAESFSEGLAAVRIGQRRVGGELFQT